MKDIIKAGDVLIMEGKAYVSMDMYRHLLNDLKIANDLAKSFSQRLNSVESGNKNRNNMKILSL